MEPISKAEVRDWLENPVTQERNRLIRERIREAELNLGVSAGQNQLQDRYIAGFILALKQVLDFDYEDEETNEQA